MIEEFKFKKDDRDESFIQLVGDDQGLVFMVNAVEEHNDALKAFEEGSK